MTDTRHARQNWKLQEADPATNSLPSETVTLALLMDIRDELQTLNAVFRCHNFQTVPTVLRDIRRNTTKKRRVRKP